LDCPDIFVSTSLEAQIESILEREENYLKVTATKAYSPDRIQDINSGKKYLEMKAP
jgi:hypothetical protein